MICKSCGTECKGEICSHCGEKMTSDAVVELPSPATVSVGSVKKARRPALSVKMVFWQSIALLFPIAYLFFDTFILLCDSLFCFSSSGSMHLHRFMERLTELSYETNTVGEIMELTMGESIKVFDTISPFFWLSGESAAGFILPMLVILLFILFCVAAGISLLLTGGRILRVRAFVNLTLIAGIGATFAPLLGILLLRVQYSFGGGLAAADIQMQHIVPSLEALCLMGILMCVLLPSLASLRHLSAYAEKEREFVCFPYRFLTKRSFKFSKMTVTICMIAFLTLIVCFFFLPIATTTNRGVGAVLQVISKDRGAILAALRGIFATGEDVSITESVTLLIGFLCDIWKLFVLIGALCALIAWLRVLLVKKDGLQKKKRKKKAVKTFAATILDTVFAPYIVFIVVQAILCIALLFFTPIAMHLDFANVNDTLSIVYLTMAYIRTIGATNTLYALLCVGGMLLWHMADQTTAALIVQASEEQKSA